MQRVAILLSISAAAILIAGVVISRAVTNSGLTLTLTRTTYGVPYQAVCFGMGTALALFAFLYAAAWFAPWSSAVAWWHLGLSGVAAVVFLGSIAAHAYVPGRTEGSVPALAALLLTPILFGALQIGFAADAVRRCLPVLLRS